MNHLEERVRQLNIERTKKDPGELNLEELWADFVYCAKQLGLIEFGIDIGVAGSEKRDRLIKLQEEIQCRINSYATVDSASTKGIFQAMEILKY